MQCTKCHYPNSHVVETKHESDDIIKRRRECVKCGHRFNTIESVKESPKDRKV